MTSIVWFRRDLRLADNPALAAALERGGPVLPVFVWAPREDGDWAPGAAGRWWLHRSLASLDAGLRERGSRLLLRRGPSGVALHALAREAGATAVYLNRRYEPALATRDAAVGGELMAAGIAVREFNSALLFEPEEIRNAAGGPYQVFTPFWRACVQRGDVPSPPQAPARIPPPGRWPASGPLASLELEPRVAWDAGLRAEWTPGEAGAAAKLEQFLRQSLRHYSSARERPDLPGSSRLSPHLHFGEIGPRQVRARCGRREATVFLRELGWREFAHHLLHHFPRTPLEPLRKEFARFQWQPDAKMLEAWQRGRTGYPLVDAGMRELWATGWMHNRVRMVVASFLVKDLLQPWQDGARWFWDTLVDADLANNTLGWQWSAGCGADAAPYFRIFNPVNQGEKFDPAGDYVRRWVPELAGLPAAWIHKPWQAPDDVLRAAGIRRGHSYPEPIVSRSVARMRALEAYREVRSNA